MSSSLPQGAKLLRGIQVYGKFDKGRNAELPAAYRKFWKEWREAVPTAVHYIPKEGKWDRDSETGIVQPIQNIPLPLKFPPESNEGLWGGEAVIKGFQKRTPYKRRVPHFWVPVLRRSVIRSEILNVYLSTVITDRTMSLIHESHGFDHYIMKTPACDLQSTLALGLKRKMLFALRDNCPAVSGKDLKMAIMNEYGKYLDQYTSEEIDWYGLSLEDALKQLSVIQKAADQIVPHKILFRQRLLEQLNDTKNSVQSKDVDITDSLPGSDGSSSWLTKMNPFGKKKDNSSG